MSYSGFAVVRAAKHKSTGEEFACKIIKLPGPNDPIGPDDVPRYVQDTLSRLHPSNQYKIVASYQ